MTYAADASFVGYDEACLILFQLTQTRQALKSTMAVLLRCDVLIESGSAFKRPCLDC